MSRNRDTNSSKVNSVFYADSYHPIQAGSIDGTDILPHDNAVYRAFLCHSAGLYDPFGDPNVIGEDPYCTVFVGRLSEYTTEDTLRKAMSKYGKVKNLRLVRHIVTGASQRYAFVEYESEREMRRAYENAHHSIIDGCEIIVDYNRQQLMPGWIPRRLGGGLGGKKESGQLRFGGRERPFRAPLRPIPWDDLKRLGIPPPPEGNYMSRFEVPPPPRRKRSYTDRDDRSEKHSRSSHRHEKRSTSRDHLYDERSSVDPDDDLRTSHRHSRHSRRPERSVSHEHEREDDVKTSYKDRQDSRGPSMSRDRERDSDTKKSYNRDQDSRRHDSRSVSRDHRSDKRRSGDQEQQPRKRHRQ